MTLAVPNQRTWATNDIVTAAMMNANVRDAVNYLANPPQCTATNSGSQSIPNNSFTALALDTNVTDTYSGHSTVTNNTRYTIVAPGCYLVIVKVAFAATSVIHRRGTSIQINSNGSIVSAQQIGQSTDTLNPFVGTVYLTTPLVAGSFIEGLAFQDSGGALATVSTSATLQVLWVSQ